MIGSVGDLAYGGVIFRIVKDLGQLMVNGNYNTDTISIWIYPFILLPLYRLG